MRLFQQFRLNQTTLSKCLLYSCTVLEQIFNCNYLWSLHSFIYHHNKENYYYYYSLPSSLLSKILFSVSYHGLNYYYYYQSQYFCQYHNLYRCFRIINDWLSLVLLLKPSPLLLLIYLFYSYFFNFRLTPLNDLYWSLLSLMIVIAITFIRSIDIIYSVMLIITKIVFFTYG